jgi:hypothetical protein
MMGCYVHPQGRKLIIQFNSKTKIKYWCDRTIPFLSQPVNLRMYRHPDDPNPFP